jgi:hypothetical protein
MTLRRLLPIRPAWILRSLTGLALVLLNVVPAVAQADDFDIQSSTDYSYGSQVSFSAQIAASATVSQAAVFVRPEGSSDTTVLYASVAAGTPTVARATLDLRTTSLAPFSWIEYWWQVDLADGRSQTTQPLIFEYIDNRFDWHTLEAAPLRLHWVSGDLPFGQGALDIATRALDRISRDLGTPPPTRLDVYVYPSLGDLQAGLNLGGRSWAGGHADPSLGVVLLAAPPGPESRALLENALPHELTHVLLYQRMGAGYGNLPTWLNEGLATLEESVPDPAQRVALEDAAAQDQLLPLGTLCSPFAASGPEALLAYAQSASLVQYLRDVYGTGAIAALLDAYQEGTTCLGGLQRVLRRTPEQLQSEWAVIAVTGHDSLARFRPFLPWLLLLVPAVLLIVFAGLVGRRRQRGTP